jgi:(2R)-sulfolactate sulfo-lyase subunit alpha
MTHKFLVHKHGDAVGVAVAEIDADESVVGVFMDDEARLQIEAREPVPFGHKIAITDIAAGSPVVEYGIPIGLAPTGLRTGEYVHTHNLRSARW